MSKNSTRSFLMGLMGGEGKVEAFCPDGFGTPKQLLNLEGEAIPYKEIDE